MIKLLKDLGLWEVRDTMCGNAMMKTISGGERKRTAIGVELISDPQIILLDEPTSGLDSHRATSIVMLLKRLARSHGKTIISTIHQPSSESYANFDKVIFMQDGHIVFQGLPYEVPQYFRDIGRDFKHFANPADVLMKILDVPYPKSALTEQSIKTFVKFYEDKQLVAIEEEAAKYQMSKLEISNTRRAPCHTQFQALLWRNWT